MIVGAGFGSVGLMGVGLRVIPQIISEHNMVEVECPYCEEEIDLESEGGGRYWAMLNLIKTKPNELLALKG